MDKRPLGTSIRFIQGWSEPSPEIERLEAQLLYCWIYGHRFVEQVCVRCGVTQHA